MSVDSDVTEILPLAATEIQLALRVFDGHLCEWLAEALDAAWARLPAADRCELAQFWINNPDSKFSKVPSPCIMAWHSPKNMSLGVNKAGVAIYYDPVHLDRVRQDAHGAELLATAIAHELAHSLHIARRRHVGKPDLLVEDEVDAMVAEWGFSGDVRKWIAEHLHVA